MWWNFFRFELTQFKLQHSRNLTKEQGLSTSYTVLRLNSFCSSEKLGQGRQGCDRRLWKVPHINIGALSLDLKLANGVYRFSLKCFVKLGCHFFLQIFAEFAFLCRIFGSIRNQHVTIFMVCCTLDTFTVRIDSKSVKYAKIELKCSYRTSLNN